MGHFLLGVISKTQDEKEIKELLKSYSSRLKVEPYILIDKEQALVKAKKHLTFLAEVYGDNAEYKDVLNSPEQEIIKWYWRSNYEGCDVDENYNLTSTYNKQSKYDGYAIGGRFSDKLAIKDKYIDKYSNKFVDQAKISDIDFDYASRHDIDCWIRAWEFYVESKRFVDGEEIPLMQESPIDLPNRYKTKENFVKAKTRFNADAILKPNG